MTADISMTNVPIAAGCLMMANIPIQLTLDTVDANYDLRSTTWAGENDDMATGMILLKRILLVKHDWH